MSGHSAEKDADEPCVCGSGFTCLARHDEPTERERLRQLWADHHGWDGTIHANIGEGLGCRFGSALRDDVCHPRVLSPAESPTATTEAER